jgi:hypothetical protein
VKVDVDEQRNDEGLVATTSFGAELGRMIFRVGKAG